MITVNACISEEAGEFLDAWLMLVEKMINPKTILESTHTLNVKPGAGVPFNPIQYLISTQKVSRIASSTACTFMCHQMYDWNITD